MGCARPSRAAGRGAACRNSHFLAVNSRPQGVQGEVQRAYEWPAPRVHSVSPPFYRAMWGAAAVGRRSVLSDFAPSLPRSGGTATHPGRLPAQYLHSHLLCVPGRASVEVIRALVAPVLLEPTLEVAAGSTVAPRRPPHRTRGTRPLEVGGCKAGRGSEGQRMGRAGQRRMLETMHRGLLPSARGSVPRGGRPPSGRRIGSVSP